MALDLDVDLRDRLADPSSRPRVLVTAEDFERVDRLRETDPLVGAWVDRLLERGRELLDEPASEYEIPDGLRLLFVSRDVLDRVRVLATCYRLTGRARFAERAWVELDAAAGFEDWNPRHFLDTAEMTTALAVGYDWLYEYLAPSQRARVREAIVENGVSEALPGYRGEHDLDDVDGGLEPHTWWMRVEHNWNTVCNGGLSIGTLALAGEDDADHDLLAEVLGSARESLERALGTLAPDGGWPEGVGYWGYNARYLAYYLATLEATLGTDLGVANSAGIDCVGDFPVHLTGVDGAFDFGDSRTEKRVDEPALHYFARRFDEPAWGGYQRESAGREGAIMDLLWYDPTCAADPWHRDLPHEARFPGAEDVAVFRSGWVGDNTFLGVKGGDNRVNHGDLDLGTFVFDSTVRWATDLGRGDYDLPGYFDDGPGGERWRYYRKRAEGHNVPVIAPDEGPDQDPTATAEVERVETRRDEAFAILDLSEAYPASVRRGVALRDGRTRLVVQDEIQSPEPREAWWFLHTPAEVELDGSRALLSRDGESIEARIASPADATFEVREAAPLPSAPHPGEEEPVAGVRKLAIHLPGVEATRIAVGLGGDPDEVEPLSAW